MNILLIGFGKTGKEIAEELSKSKHNIFFISPSKKKSKFTQVSLDKIPKDIKPEKITYEECMKIIHLVEEF